MTEKELLSIEEFMDIFSQTRSATYSQIKKGKLLIRKQGARTFIRKEDAMAWRDALEGMQQPE